MPKATWPIGKEFDFEFWEPWFQRILDKVDIQCSVAVAGQGNRRSLGLLGAPR